MNYSSIISTVSFNKNAMVVLFLALASAQADADGWAMFSQQAQMKNYVIVDVGEASKVEPTYNAKWNKDVYQMNGRCFVFPGYMGYWGYGNKAAFLLVNAQKSIQLALVETAIGSVKVELQSIAMIECPSGNNVMPYSDNSEEQLMLLKKRQAELKKKLEDLQQQK